MAVPGCVALGMLGCNAGCCAIWTSEDNGTADGARGHVQRLGRGVDDLVNGLHCKVEGHELHNGTEAGKGCPSSNSREAGLQEPVTSLNDSPCAACHVQFTLPEQFDIRKSDAVRMQSGEG